MKLDLSKFKKVSENHNSAILKNPKGHEIKIAKNTLSPDLRSELDKLPIYAADGANTLPDDSDDSEVPAEDTTQGLPATQAAPVEQEPIQTESSEELGLPSDQEVAQAPVPQPQPDLKTQLQQEQAFWENDLKNQHITPQTYHDLFAKKDTLGKIGMIFGMALSSAGSGLSHQPNVMLEMMNKQIQNDLEAQKSSKVNAQNFLRLSQQHELQVAQIGLMQKQGLLTEQQAEQAKQTGLLTAAETTQMPAKTQLIQAQTRQVGQQAELLRKEGFLTDAQAKGAIQEADTKSFALTQARLLQTSYHDLSLKVDGMPHSVPGKPATPAQDQAYQQAVQQLGIIYSKMGDKINNVNDQAAGASALYNMTIGGQDGQGNDQEQQFQQANRALRLGGQEKLAEDREQKHFPGIQGQASASLSPADREYLNSGITFQRQVEEFTKWAQTHSGDLNLKDRNEGIAKAADLQGAYRQATHGGVFRQGEQNFISKIIDNTPTKFFNSIRVIPPLQAIGADNRTRVDQYAKNLGFNGFPQYKTYNGKKYMRGPKGEPIEVK